MAVPKGRILNELIPLLKKVDIVPEKEFLTLTQESYYLVPITSTYL